MAAINFEEKSRQPMFQAIGIFSIAFVLMLLSWLLKMGGVLKSGSLVPWSIATAFMLLFAIMNSLLSLRSDNSMKYWGASVYAYLGLALCTGLAAWMFSGIALADAESYKFIYLVVTFGFLVFLSIVNMMKRIVNFAEREEWTQPRQRGRKR